MTFLLVASEEVVGEDRKSVLLIDFIQCYYPLSRGLTALQ